MLAEYLVFIFLSTLVEVSSRSFCLGLRLRIRVNFEKSLSSSSFSTV